MRIAILGGSFNPLHVGHTMLAEAMIKEYGYTKVLFVPTCIPPHKEIKDGATTLQRLEMLEAFCCSEGRGYFEVDDCEIRRGGVSYTYDTLLYILEKYSGKLEGKPALLMGQEIAAEFDKWKNPDLIAKMADIFIVPRYPDYATLKMKFEKNADSLASHKNQPTGDYKGDFSIDFDEKSFRYSYILLKEPMLPVSSTEIRARIANNQGFRYLVPQAIFEYILNNDLYKVTSKNCNF